MENCNTPIVNLSYYTRNSGCHGLSISFLRQFFYYKYDLNGLAIQVAIVSPKFVVKETTNSVRLNDMRLNHRTVAYYELL